MKDFILLMHADSDDNAVADDGRRWSEYLSKLRESRCFDGGSSVGQGIMFKRNRPDKPSEPNFTGFMRVRAESLSDAKRFLEGNPVFEAGGTVEIRELPRDE
jgi:hypothetical protein